VTDLYQRDPGQYPYILVSTAAGHNSRFDILFAHPQKILTLDSHALAGEQQGFLASLHDCWVQERIDIGADDSSLPFTGGWFIYLSYELAAEIEPVLKLPVGSRDDPVAMAARCPAAVIYDHQHQQHIAVAENEYAELLDAIEQDFNNAVTAGNAEPTTAAIKVHAVKEADEKPYLGQVNRIKQYIVDGDIFQANLSRPWSLELDHQISDTALFNSLATANPGSFAVLARLPASTVISSSPERLVSVHQGVIETRPIAGTRPRSDDQQLDQQLASELMAHPKERAEHIMLIDLERNDLGRICVPGSIKVNELMVLESYQHVHHIVSNVVGRLRDDVSPADVIRAVFPGGTITGCPKVRCMEILAEMEQQARGAYTGSIGYINRNGDMDLNILIRTLVRKGNNISFRAGGGIVADSDPQHELAETRAKAKGLLRALGIE
jgi:anthranilate synthase component 1